MKILVCDDEKIYTDTISANVRSYFNSKNIPHSISAFTDSSEVLKSDMSYDIAFLDIEMAPINGIEIARELKNINSQAVVFIITSFNKYIDDAMDLQLFRYIQKPLEITRLFTGLDKALEILSTKQISFYIPEESSVIRMSSDEVVYVEIVDRKTRITTINNAYTTNLSIKEWSKMLPSTSFYMVHSSFIVNVKHITKYSRDTVTLCNQHLIPVSYRKQAEFKRFFMNYNK